METTVTPFNSSTSLSNLSQFPSSQPFKSDIDFDPQKAPGKIAHNSDPNSCYVAVLLNTIRDENLKSLFMASKITDKQIAKDLREVLWPCINKINQGSLKRDYRCDEGVVSVEEISKIQAVLRRHNIIERDASTDEDPMGVLHCVLEHVAPEFILFKGTETHHYNLKEAKKSEEVILTETELGPTGVTVVDKEGKMRKDISDITISLSSPLKQINLSQALQQHLTDDLENEEVSAVYVCQEESENKYIKYSNVGRLKTIRTFSTAPLTLILEVKGSFDSNALESRETEVVFQERMEVKTEDGMTHYYMLQQVNCHQSAHEYAYLKHENAWFLSDDLNPVQKATIEKRSKDIQAICRYGRTFIYTKVNKEAFEKIGNKFYRYHPSTSMGNPIAGNMVSSPLQTPPQVSSIENPVSNDTLFCQLQALIKICEGLSNPTFASLHGLLELSWGIANIPKEKKFSKKWGAVIAERHWLLLEDISRQMAAKYPNYPHLSDFYSRGSKQLVSKFSESAKTLKTIFATLKNMENSQVPNLVLKPPEKPFELVDIETLFYSDFDCFVLGQVERNINIIKNTLGLQNPVDWLKANSAHIKALFRTIEVIGEASKILSKKTRQQLPTLIISSDKNKEKSLWGKLRDQLHHHKSRSWDIANYAPEKWADLLIQLLLKLESEIISYKNIKQTNSNTGLLNTKDAEILEALSKLCGEEQYTEVRRAWYEIKSDFKTDPIQLQRILFGFETVEENFLKIWNTHAEPYLKPEADANKNQIRILEMLRIGRGNLIQDIDIKKLAPSVKSLDKNNAIAEMKRLLNSVTQTNGSAKRDELARAFDRLADQFVFLKHESIKKKTSKTANIKEIIQRDPEKNETLKKLMSQRLSQVRSYQFSEAVFKNQDHSLTEYGELMESYIKLKHYRISHLIERMNQLLKEIENSWPNSDADSSNLETFGKSTHEKTDPKNTFIDRLKELQKEEKFINVPKRSNEDLLKKLKIVPAGRIANHFKQAKGKEKDLASTDKLVEEINKSKVDCKAAIGELTLFLKGIDYTEFYIRSRVAAELNNAIMIFQNFNKSKQDVQTVKEIFTHFAFTDTATFIKELNQAHIPHLFTEKSPSLNSLKMKVLSNLESQLETDLEMKVDRLISEAENELSTSYVQKALHFNAIQISTLPEVGIDPRRYVVLLREIYQAGLDKHASDYQIMLLAWDNIERKIECRRLSAEEIQKVFTWLSSDESIAKNEKQKSVKKDLFEYLDGVKGFDLSDLPRFERTHKKIETFKTFLKEECFPSFPDLEARKDTLISYFKVACGIIDTQSKAESFINHFVRKIQKLGKVFSEILELENTQTPSQNSELFLLGAEYEMQDIGELAQLITDRPSLWNRGRHMLSPQHLLWISLMRKMMAHYPLILAPHTMRWNLEYLAFDTRNFLFNNNTISSNIPPAEAPKRKPITSQDLHSKIFDIEDYLDCLNLSIKIEVLHPSLHAADQSYLHPFGDLALMVYPSSQTQSKREFIHAVKELELILNYELNAKVSVIGEWDSDIVNIPVEKHIPLGYLKMAINNKQTVHNWILSMDAYHFFLHKPWSRIVYKSGLVVTRGDFGLHHDLLFFLKVLEFHGNQEDLKQFVNMPNLKDHIHNALRKQYSQVRDSYSESMLFKWICCLFERFCPPETVPQCPVSLPRSYKDQRPFITMVDKNFNCLQLLPKNREELEADGFDDISFYYKQNKRLDILNDRSLLDPLVPACLSELDLLSDYAASVLRSHLSYIQEKLNPDNGLDSSRFTEVVSIRIADPALSEKEASLSSIQPAVQTLIEDEAKNLGSLIIHMITNFSSQHGNDFCVWMLEWMEVDKEIGQVARDYYGKNRLRLKELYIQMDDMSRRLFDKLYITSGLGWSDFPFVNSFQKFIHRVYLETDSLNVEDLYGQILVSGDFSANFKALVIDKDIQESLLRLMKKRKKIMHLTVHSFLKRYPSSLYAEMFKKEINGYYSKWDQLFRMVNSPKVFEVLKSCIEKGKKFSGTEKRRFSQLVQFELKKAFETQYKNPVDERENNIASTSTRKMQLYESRSYFDGKNTTDQAKKNEAIFLKLLKNPNFKTTFQEDWKKQYGVAFGPLYYKNVIREARETLTTLINTSGLPDHNFEIVPTYSDYWTFVKDNPVEMSGLLVESGLGNTFKKLVLEEGWSFQKIWENPKKRQALEQNKRLHRLVEAYMNFFNLENALSDVSKYLELHAKAYTQKTREKEKAKQSKKEEWVIEVYDKRLTNTKKRLKKASLKFEETLNKITKTEFFGMLKLSVRWKSILKQNKDALSDAEQEKQALQQLLEKTAFVSQDLLAISIEESIELGPYLKLFCSSLK